MERYELMMSDKEFIVIGGGEVPPLGSMDIPYTRCIRCRTIRIHNALCGCEIPRRSYGPSEAFYPEHPRMEGRFDNTGRLTLHPIKEYRYTVFESWIDPETNRDKGRWWYENGLPPFNLHTPKGEQDR